MKHGMVHCSATPADQELTPEKLSDMHAKRSIRRPGGYHRYVRRNGDIIKLREFESQGAHAVGYNKTHVGICYEGGIIAAGNPNRAADAKDTRTHEQRLGIMKCITELMYWNYQNLDEGETVELLKEFEVIGHRDVSPDQDGDGIIEPWEFMKQCPCFDAKPEYENYIIAAWSTMGVYLT